MASHSNIVYDVAIVGAGPAGCAAAVGCRAHDARVVVIEAGPAKPTDETIAWIGAAGVDFVNQCGIDAKAAKATPFQGVRLHSWDLKRRVDVDDEELTGWLVQRGTIQRAWQRVLAKAGVAACYGERLTALRLGEDEVELRLAGGTALRARLVIIADGTDSETAKLANLVAAGDSIRHPVCVQMTFEAERAGAGLDVVVGGGRGAQMATVARLGKTVRLSVLNRDPVGSDPAEFERFVEAARAAELVSGRAVGQAVTRASPAGVALDVESHVGKRSLLIGDAGGFVAAFSNEGIYPAMRSGSIAAETAMRALGAEVMQDELATFGAAWRTELADYLRMPNTDLSLLMPLVFNNPRMSLRVARAFLLGQKF